MTLPISLPQVNWAGDWLWVAYQIFQDPRVPPPHTWQDWIITGLMVVVVVAFFVVGAYLCYLWQRDVMGTRFD